MNPFRANLHALIAFLALRMGDCRNRGNVDAGSVRHQFTSLSNTHGQQRRRSAARSAPETRSPLDSALPPFRNLPIRHSSTTCRAAELALLATPTCDALAFRQGASLGEGRERKSCLNEAERVVVAATEPALTRCHATL